MSNRDRTKTRGLQSKTFDLPTIVRLCRNFLLRYPSSKNSFALFPDGGGIFHFDEEKNKFVGSEELVPDRHVYRLILASTYMA